MPSLSTHVLDSAKGGPWPGVAVSVYDDEQGTLVASGTTGPDGRAASLASAIAPGRYRIVWGTAGTFLAAVSVTVLLAEDRHYHVPLLASPASAVAYLGA